MLFGRTFSLLFIRMLTLKSKKRMQRAFILMFGTCRGDRTDFARRAFHFAAPHTSNSAKNFWAQRLAIGTFKSRLKNYKTSLFCRVYN